MDTRNWTRENLAWLAGFYEGEGCLYVGFRKRDRKEFLYHFDITSTDEDVLKKALNIAGTGKVVSVGKNEAHHKERFRFRLFKIDEIYALCIAMYPWLGIRRRSKIEEFVGLYKKYDVRPQFKYEKDATCINCGIKIGAKQKGRGYCKSCYMNWYRNGDPSKGSKRIALQKIDEDMPMLLDYDGIDNCKVCKKELKFGKRARGMCNTCYMRWRRAKKKQCHL